MRSLTAGMQSAISATVIRPVYLVRLEFGASTVIYLNDTGNNISWSGQTWLGNGWLQPVKSVQETPDVKATGCEITLMGTITQLVTYALTDARIGNGCEVYLGLLDANQALIADPYLLFKGKLDVPTITQSDDEFTITISYESELRGLFRKNEFRYTDEAQKALFSGDRGFQYQSTMETWDGYWGKPERPKWFTRKRSQSK